MKNLQALLEEEGLVKSATSSNLMRIDKDLRKALPKVIGPAHKLTMKDRKVDKAIRDLVLALDDILTEK